MTIQQPSPYLLCVLTPPLRGLECRLLCSRIAAQTPRRPLAMHELVGHALKGQRVPRRVHDVRVLCALGAIHREPLSGRCYAHKSAVVLNRICVALHNAEVFALVKLPLHGERPIRNFSAFLKQRQRELRVCGGVHSISAGKRMRWTPRAAICALPPVPLLIVEQIPFLILHFNRARSRWHPRHCTRASTTYLSRRVARRRFSVTPSLHLLLVLVRIFLYVDYTTGTSHYKSDHRWVPCTYMQVSSQSVHV